ncbi:hypothetical protein Ddc_10189 [Ditylenchus destructor]|nr:hypothetical protein Ddc_10189 [Ditylenchus destructor]
MIRCKEALLKTTDPEKHADVKERLQKMELLAKKLKVQLIMCASVVIFSVAVYFLIWYNSECWALPFQESPCMQPGTLPLISTNTSTLAEAADEFILSLRPQITKFHDAILMNDQAERHKLSTSAKTEIGQLMHQHFLDLVAFSALIEEDLRLWKVERAIVFTYVGMALVSTIISIFIIGIAGSVMLCKLSGISKKEVLSAEESENLQNARLKQLKRQIPILYTVTFACIAAGFTLYSIFITGHYYSGSSPLLVGSMGSCNCNLYLNFSTTLETTLNKRFAKLDNAMESSALEVRQAIWPYESEAIEAAIEHYLDLKKHDVDRRTVPRKYTRNKPPIFFFVVLLYAIIWLEQTRISFEMSCFRHGLVYSSSTSLWAGHDTAAHWPLPQAKSCRLFVNNACGKMNRICPEANVSMTQASKLYLKVKNKFKKLISYELSDSEDPEKPGDVKKQLKSMEQLEKELVFKRDSCAFAVIVIVAGYFLMLCFSECWALPFQESLCKRTRDLPLFATNQSSLAEAVNEFTLALQAQVAKFRDTIEIPDLADRQTLSNATKNEIAQLFSQHSPDLVAFRALKREDERLREMEDGIESGYVQIVVLLLMISFISLVLFCPKIPETRTEEMSVEENEYSQKARLKHLKRRIPLLYIVAYTFIWAQIALFVIIYAGHFYNGSSPFFRGQVKWNENDCSVASNEYKLKYNCTFTDYPNYATELEAILNKNFDKLDSFMASPILEVRQTAWSYGSDVREAAIENHLELKQYNVDQRTMPRKIGIVFPGPFSFVISLVIVTFYFRCFLSSDCEEESI